MKKILVPTDFSSDALNAADFAANIALKADAELVLLNAFHLPSAGANVMISLDGILKENALRDLEEQRENLLAKYAGLKVKTLAELGFAVDVIKSTVNSEDIDLVVMGTKGATNIGSKMFGSNTFNTVKKIDTPVIVVPAGAEFIDLHEIVLATDMFDYKNKNFSMLVDLAVLFNSKIKILKIVESVEAGANEGGVENITEADLGGHKITQHYVESDDIEYGITKFNLEEGAPLMAVISRDHSFFENIVHKSVTKGLVMHAVTPLLVLRG